MTERLTSISDNARQRLVPYWSLFVLLTVSLVGVVDAGYLTLSHYQKASVNCSILDGCNVVLNSSFATLFGIPTALFGVLFYLTVCGGVLGYVLFRKLSWLYGVCILAILSVFISLGFVYIQAFVINAWCFYCLISAILSVILGSVGVYLVYHLNQQALFEKT